MERRVSGYAERPLPPEDCADLVFTVEETLARGPAPDSAYSLIKGGGQPRAFQKHLLRVSCVPVPNPGTVEITGRKRQSSAQVLFWGEVTKTTFQIFLDLFFSYGDIG